MNIKQKLIVLLLLMSFIPTLAVGAVAYATISRDLAQKSTDQLESIAIKQEQKINGLLQKKREEVTKLANQYDFQVAMAGYLSAKTKDPSVITTVLQSQKTEVPDMQAIYVANFDGSVVASTESNTEGKKLDHPEYFKVHPAEETTTVVREDPRDGIDKLYINANLRVNKKDAGVLSVVFRIDDIVAAIQDYTGLGTTGETLIAARNSNNDVISLFPLRFDTDAALQTKLNNLDLFSPSAQGTVAYHNDYRGEEVLVTTRAIGFADWVIATKIDKTEALATTTQLRTSLISIIIVSAAIIMIIAWYVARFYTGPILRIQRAAKQIGQGVFSARVDLKRNDELGALGDSINSMGSSLGDLVANIEHQRNHLRIILDSTTESILAVDKQGKILIANRAAAGLTGLTAQELVGKRIQDVFAWTQAAQPFAVDYNTPGTAIYPDLQFVNRSGNEFFIKLLVNQIKGQQQDQAAQSIITIHDETKSRELENMKIDFVSMAAHELRTPLAAIRGYLELIKYKESKSVTPAADKYIKQALKGTAELGGLINSLLDVTRIEKGTLVLHMDKTDLAANLSHAIEAAMFGAREKEITLSYEGPDKDAFVVGDEIALREVANNLLANAIKYTSPKGKVGVRLQRHDDTYKVTVTDTGIGIPKHAMSNLFTKFYRVHGGLDSGSTGTGLGLFISRSIIERHNGSIDVESEEGKGSVFTFAIPVFSQERLESIQDEGDKTMRRQRGWVTKNTAR